MAVHFVSRQLRARVLDEDEPLWLVKHPRRSYLVALYKATPPWVTRQSIQKIQQEAKWFSRLRGVEHVMDHIVPLNHPLVCGLNVPWNIQLITRAQNAAKSNIWCPDQLNFEFENHCIKDQLYKQSLLML